MGRTGMRGGWPGAIVAVVALLVVTFLWLYPAPMLLSHQGRQSLLAARSLNTGEGFAVTPEIPFAKFGPLYPMLLALLARLGVGVGAAVHLINGVALAGTLLGLYALGRSLGIRRPAAVLVLYGLLGANHLLLRSARPDLIVVCAATLALVAFVRYAREPSMLALISAAVCSSVAATSRYVAVLALLPVFLVAVRLAGTSWRVRVRDLAIFGGIAAGPVSLWMLRNYLVTGFLTGMSRTKVRLVALDQQSFVGQITGLVKTIWIDLFSPNTLGLRRIVYRGEALDYRAVTIAAGLLTVAALAGLFWIRRAELAANFREQARQRSATFHALVLVAAYTALYTIVLIVVWSLSNNDPLHTRYVSPMYGYGILLGAALATAATRGASRILQAVPAGVLLLILGLNLPKAIPLLGHAQPPPTLVTVQEAGEPGSLWISDLTWSRLDEIRPRRRK